MKRCKSCNKDITKDDRYGGYCQSCYNYFRKGGTINSLPEKGVIAKDDRGYIVCHICGKAYKRLGSHIKESHNMTILEYKAEFGLCNNARTTENNYSKHMHNLAYKHDMPKQLIKTGVATRVKPGDKHLRKGKKVRLQECIDKRVRMRRYFNDQRTICGN
jgi:hypothetical protein